MSEREQVKRAALELLGRALPHMKWETAIEVMRAMSAQEGDGGTVVVSYSRVPILLIVGADEEDVASAADAAAFPQYEVIKRCVGQAICGKVVDRIVYGPRLKSLLDWHGDAVLPRLKPDAEGRR
jgi:hypothetical protein